jgi:Phage derived protein Gp49-like (DUF891)
MDYISPQGRNVIADWYTGLLAQEQSDFQALMRILAKTRQWHRGAFKLLGRQYRGLGELRFDSERKAHRVIGCFGPALGQFTMLIGCFHKQRVYTPANALDTALRRKRFLERGEGSVHERKI